MTRQSRYGGGQRLFAGAAASVEELETLVRLTICEWPCREGKMADGLS